MSNTKTEAKGTTYEKKMVIDIWYTQNEIVQNNDVDFDEDLIDLFMKDQVIGVEVVCLDNFRIWDYILVS